MLDKNSIYYINEHLSLNINDLIFIHHPITEDIVRVKIKELKKNDVVVCVPEDSDYYGQPDFIIKKYHILSS